MGIYTRLARFRPKQHCAVCAGSSTHVVCQSCEDEFSASEWRCLSCALPLNQSLDYCGNCLRTSPSFHRAFTLYDYEGVVAFLIKKMKYEARLSVAQFFAGKVAEKIGEMQSSGHHYDAFIPMPLHKKRIRERGYNQVIELLRSLKSTSPIETNSAQRVKQTTPLTDLTLAQRKKEIKGAFNLLVPLTYKSILLVDDVMTTGSTASACAKILLENGASSIEILTITRGIPA